MAAVDWIFVWSISTFLVYVARAQICSPSAANPQVLQVTDSIESFYTLNWPLNYTANTDCYWLLQPKSGYNSIGISFVAFDLEASSNCINNDYFHIRDGEHAGSASLAVLCGSFGTLAAHRLISVSPFATNSLFLHFHSDSDAIVGQGTTFTYSGKKKPTLSSAVWTGIAVAIVFCMILIAGLVAVLVLKQRMPRVAAVEEPATDDEALSSDSQAEDTSEEETELGAQGSIPSLQKQLPTYTVSEKLPPLNNSQSAVDFSILPGSSPPPELSPLPRAAPPALPPHLPPLEPPPYSRVDANPVPVDYSGLPALE